MSGEPGGRRASDADRERAVGVLNDALVNGELRPDEHGDRVQAALDATTLGDLDRLIVDLTFPSAPRPKRSNWFRWFAIGAAAAALALIGDLIGQTGPTPAAVGTSPAAQVAPHVPSAGDVAPSPTSTGVNGLVIQVVPPGAFAQYDPADECGAFGAFYAGGGSNCYLVVQFTNTGSSPVGFRPADLRMVDQSGDTYSIAPVDPTCYDSTDVNEIATVEPNQHLAVQLCYPVMTGAVPQALQGTRSLDGLSLSVPQTAIHDTWGGS